MPLLITFTSIITIISDICNKTDELKQVIHQFKKVVEDPKCEHKVESLYKELLNEIDKPVIDVIRNILKDYDELCVVQETLDKLEKEVVPVLNDSELERYRNFVKQLKIIDSDPSDRFINLVSKRWGEQNKAEFGTADKLKIDIMTGNQSAGRHILNHKRWKMSMIIHRSRDVVGRKLEQKGIIY